MSWQPDTSRFHLFPNSTNDQQLTFPFSSVAGAVCPSPLTRVEPVASPESGQREGVHAKHFVDLTECNKSEGVL